MVNKFPNEEELIRQIKQDKVYLSPLLWDTIYSMVGENITVIDLIVNYNLENGGALGINEVKKIMQYLEGINKVFEKILNPMIIKTGDNSFKVIEDESRQMHKGIKTLLGHYIGNGIQLINMILGYHLDENEPVDKDGCLKILSHFVTMKDVLKRLFELTAQSETLDEIIRNKLQVPMYVLETFKDKVAEEDRERFYEAVKNIQEIAGLLERKNRMNVVG